MTRNLRQAAILPLAMGLALAACDRSAPPSDKVKDAMEGAVAQVSGSVPQGVAEGLYAPRDECAAIEGAAEFRQRLAAAVADRDADAFAALAAEDIRLDFGGGAGRDMLTSRLTDPEYELWSELETLLEMGCAPGQAGGIVLPWIFAQQLDDGDPYSGMIVTGERVPLRRAADDSAPVLESISWDVVELVGGLRPEEPYQRVRAADDVEGFIATDSLRSLIDYRLLASSRDGRWAINALVAGD